MHVSYAVLLIVLCMLTGCTRGKPPTSSGTDTSGKNTPTLGERLKNLYVKEVLVLQRGFDKPLNDGDDLSGWTREFEYTFRTSGESGDGYPKVTVRVEAWLDALRRQVYITATIELLNNEEEEEKTTGSSVKCSYFQIPLDFQELNLTTLREDNIDNDIGWVGKRLYPFGSHNLEKIDENVRPLDCFLFKSYERMNHDLLTKTGKGMKEICQSIWIGKSITEEKVIVAYKENGGPNPAFTNFPNPPPITVCKEITYTINGKEVQPGDPKSIDCNSLEANYISSCDALYAKLTYWEEQMKENIPLDNN